MGLLFAISRARALSLSGWRSHGGIWWRGSKLRRLRAVMGGVGGGRGSSSKGEPEGMRDGVAPMLRVFCGVCEVCGGEACWFSG